MRRTVLIVMVALAAAACGGDDAPAHPDSVVALPPDSAATVATAAPRPRWDAAYGPAIFVVSSSGIRFIAPEITDSTFADSSAWAGVALGGVTQAEFFARAGRLATVPLAHAGERLAPDLQNSCVDWPVVGTTDALHGQWSVGFAPGLAVAMPLDSIEALARGDSARLAAEVTRIASQIPNDTAVAFAGLPFIVRTAYRIHLGGDTTALVANLTRHIGQEADPREQHVFLVAEQASPSAPWRLAWHTRSSGPEDDVETRELLAAVRLGAGHTPAIVIGVSDNDGGSYQLVTRSADGTWVERWSSAYAGC